MTPRRVILHVGRRWLYFAEPVTGFCAWQLAEVQPMLRETVRLARARGWYAAGMVSYEAAPAFDPACATHAALDWPLLWFGLYRRVVPMALPPAPPLTLPALQTPEPAGYHAALARIRAHIRDGDSYQVNYTVRLGAAYAGEAWPLFLQFARHAPYGAFLEFERYAVCCASPELFFRLRDGRIITRPMKGTAPRGLTLAEDRERAAALRHSAKDRAENLMITDMLRNDLGRVAVPGSVQVPRLFTLEKYPSLWQMTSTITAVTRAPVEQLFGALFPCASITGAPKINTMRIIRALETTPRGVYTGSIGFITPRGDAQFNVAIRTAVVDKNRRQLSYGSGGGIVWDSVAEREYRECLLKARALHRPQPVFQLLETLRRQPGHGFFLLDYHLRRLQDSARYFGYRCDLAEVTARLHALAETLPPLIHRVRLLLAQDGTVHCEATPLGPPAKKPARVALAKTPIDTGQPFVFHKTTHREMYTPQAGYDDVIFWNPRGEVTESCIANVVVYQNGQWLTPPVACGLLDGTYRRFLLDQGRIREAVISIARLQQAEAVFLINSVRGWRQVRFPQLDFYSSQGWYFNSARDN